MKNYNRIIVIIFCLFLFSVKSSAQETYDIFPLASGMHYTYTFYQEEKNYELAYLIQINSDSGDIEYIILDSLQYGDTLKVWNIEQRRELLHYKFYAPSWDTTYFIIDTSYYSLYEYLAGDHELICSSMVWFFPLSAWPSGYLTNSDSRVYRYSDLPNVLNVLSAHDPYGSWGREDSIWFSIEAGMYRRVTDTYWVSISQLHYKRYIQRTDIPIDVKQSRGNIIKNYVLLQNYPNPFNPATTIEYQIPELSFVTLKVYDVLGTEIATLVNEEKPAGTYEVKFSLGQNSILSLSSGVYFYTLSAGGFRETKKMILMR